MIMLQSLTDTIQNLPRIITAIGGLGTAAFGLVDTTKTLPGFLNANNIGFGRIKAVVSDLTPGAAASGLTQSKIIDTLHANWSNGKDLASQKAIAKSLIKVGLNTGNAAALAAKTGVDAPTLQAIATSIASNTALTPAQSDVYSRFDFVLTALLDEVYQDSDQTYTNWTRVWAGVFAIVLAFIGGWILHTGTFVDYWWTRDMGTALVIGVLATPLAPIAKDLSSAIATAVNTMQAVKGKTS